MKHLILILMMLAMAGCDLPVRRSEAESIAEDMADAHTSGLQARLEELEQKLDREERVDDARDNYTEAIHAELTSEAKARAEQDEIIRQHYNDHLSQFHGATR